VVNKRIHGLHMNLRSPCHTMATTGDEQMKLTRPLKKGLVLRSL
jgi:hypothetical protein